MVAKPFDDVRSKRAEGQAPLDIRIELAADDPEVAITCEGCGEQVVLGGLTSDLTDKVEAVKAAHAACGSASA